MRVAIEEDSDEEDDEPKIEDVTDSAQSKPKQAPSIESKFPLKTASQIEAHTRESKMQMKNGAQDFMRKFNARAENEKAEKEAKAANALKSKNETKAPPKKESPKKKVEEEPKDCMDDILTKIVDKQVSDSKQETKETTEKMSKAQKKKAKANEKKSEK